MEIDLATIIAGVTVFPDRAQVVRRGEAHLDVAGVHTLRIGGLPAAVQRDSLRATGRGPAGTRILGVEQAPEYHPAAPEETLRHLRDEIERLERELALVAEREKTIEEQRGWLRDLGAQSARSFARGMARGSARPEDASSFFAYAADESQRLAAAALDLERQRADTQRELEARRREYARAGGGQQPDRVAASVRVELASPGTLAVELSYLIAGGSWRPRYDARVDVAASRVHLTQQALVTQRTGEEWVQVPLALSTARPSAAASLPDDPSPWYVDAPHPVPLPAPRAMSARPAASAPLAMQPAGARLEDAAAEYSLAELAGADVERSGAAQIFRLPGDVDVPSDGSPHTLGLGDYELACRLDYVAMPVMAPGAHLRAVAANATGRVLLPGELHVFHAGAAGDEYVGATHLDLTAEGADLTLYLGVDDSITVKRELIERDTDKGNLLQRGIRRVTLGYRVTLGNRTAAVQRVILKDLLPVPRHERIKVTDVELRPQPTSRTRLDQLTWELSLAPGEERRIEWRFVVEAPAELYLVGLP
jgi:uncharacterized protein (TIGR02231 family)